MFCTRCGTQLGDTVKFCSECGQATARPNFQSSAYAHAQPPLSRPRDNRKIAGVCAGLARYLGADVTLVRLIALILVFVPPFPALIAYIVAWIVMPNDPCPAVAYSQTANGQA